MHNGWMTYDYKKKMFVIYTLIWSWLVWCGFCIRKGNSLKNSDDIRYLNYDYEEINDNLYILEQMFSTT